MPHAVLLRCMPLLSTEGLRQIVDESHRIRRAASGTLATEHTQLLQLLASVPRLVLCTGTPAQSRWCDIFTQAELIRPSLFGGCWSQFYEDYDVHTLSQVPSKHQPVCDHRTRRGGLCLGAPVASKMRSI